MVDLRFFEYDTVDVALSDRRARRLDSEAGRYLSVTPHPDPEIWSVTAREYVGTLVVDDMRILIRPKIRPENLFLLLEVGLPEQAWRKEDFDYEINPDLLLSLVSFYARTLETTLARGLYRSYRNRNEDLKAIRGRIDFGRQLSRARLPMPVACRYGEFTSDVLENRGLRAAIRLSLRVAGVPPSDRRRLMRELVAMEEVSDTPVSGDDLQRIHYTRLNDHYRPALGLARLLLDNLTLVDRRGGTTAASFMVNMNDLFERFVTERLRHALHGRLTVEDQTDDYLDIEKAVRIRPDLRFHHPGSGSVTYVGDIKYKLTSDAVARSADYYQLLAYTTALDLPEGVLIYCQTDGGKPAGKITVRHAGKRLHVRPVNLSGSPAEVAREIEVLATWIADRSEHVRPRTPFWLARPA
ncbi:McrC family protein [Candidatus Spongiisocius sp.]|uniref:McrC family protein n=1 Tax=Candidatus Spongiisocius sp. TaxID=3101273 RepID=UPI003B5CD4E7